MKIFSYIINFIRFRESQTKVIDEHFNKAEQTKLRIESLFNENQDKEEQLAELERNRIAVERQLQEREKRNTELRQRLLELKKSQERVAEKLERVKEEQSHLKGVLEEKTTTTMSVKQEAAKLKPYASQSPAALEASLRELNSSLASDKSEIDRLDRRARALQTSTDTFTTLITDVASTTRLLTDLQTDLVREEDESMKAVKHRDALSERSANVREVERQEKMLKKQLSNWTARTQKLRATADDRAAEAGRKMEELRTVHAKLADERGERGREVERKRVRIEQVEKKVCPILARWCA